MAMSCKDENRLDYRNQADKTYSSKESRRFVLQEPVVVDSSGVGRRVQDDSMVAVANRLQKEEKRLK
jgi:hypothetical protein